MLAVEPLDFWWPVLIATAVVLALAIGVIGLVLTQQRVKLRLNREKLAIIEKSERRYSELFNNVTDLIYVHSLDGTILQVNPALSQLLGYDPAKVIGHKLIEFIRPRFKLAYYTYLSQLSAHKHLQENSGVVRVDSLLHAEPRYFEFRYKSIVEEENRITIQGIARDITDRIQQERSLRKQERRLQRLLSESRMMQENLSLLSQKMLTIQEEERRNISRVLHDDVGQMLATVLVNLEILNREAGTNLPDIKKFVNESKSLTERVIGCVRKSLRELRPETLDQLGLLPSIRQYATDFEKRTGVHVEINEHEIVESLSEDQKLALFRILQESLKNVEKHSHAHRVSLNMYYVDEEVGIELTDDGDGFDMSARYSGGTATEPHLGLLSMQERSRLVDGHFSISSTIHQGTCVKLRFLLPDGDDSKSILHNKKTTD